MRKKICYLVGLLLLLKLTEVELKLLTFKDVTISTANLTRTAGDASKKLASEELISKSLLDGVGLLVALEATELSLGRLTLCTLLLLALLLLTLFGLGLLRLGFLGLLIFLLLLDLLLLSLLGLLWGLLLGLLAELDAVVLQEPLTEGSGIDHDDSVAHKSVGTDELVVGSVVNDIHDTSACGHCLSGPGEVAGLKTKSTVLDDTVAATNKVDDLLAETSHGRLAANLELPLLAISNTLATSWAALVHGITSNAHLPINTDLCKNKQQNNKKQNKTKTKKSTK